MQEVKIQNLVLNVLTQEQFEGAEKDASQLYLTPDTSIDSSEKGAANGVATLDVNGKVSTEQIPVATASALGVVKPDGTTITVTENGTLSAAISGEVVATKAELQDRVAKAGDTMTGTLKISGGNEVRFGTDDNYYFIKKINNGTFEIYNKNGKGLFLQAEEAHAPSYWDGTNGYRLLTTADLQSLQTQINSLNTEVTGMLGRMNFNARVDFSASNAQPYTVPSKGYLWVDYTTGELEEISVYINGGILTTTKNVSTEPSYVRLFVPVSEGDVVSVSPDTHHPISPACVSGFFAPQI